ncbi:MAG: transcriptional repressor, partial [Phycisphaerae bacterium]|nr:transcriptional repressor [Phycisphaerae bacterium]
EALLLREPLLFKAAKMNFNKDKISLLKKAKLRCTPARIGILSILLGSESAVTGKEIGKLLDNKYDKTTIYRTLESFLQASIVHKAFLQDKQWYFELADRCQKQQCHPHFACRLCGKYFCLESVNYPVIPMPENFKLLRQKILVEGVCPDCGNQDQRLL